MLNGNKFIYKLEHSQNQKFIPARSCLQEKNWISTNIYQTWAINNLFLIVK
jgi:hypothetical protein